MVQQLRTALELIRWFPVTKTPPNPVYNGPDRRRWPRTELLPHENHGTRKPTQIAR